MPTATPEPASTRYQRFVDWAPTWLLALIVFAPGWTYVIAYGGKLLGIW